MQHVKTNRAPVKPSIYSSDEDDKKSAAKRKSNVKPKSSATITPKTNSTLATKLNSNSKQPKVNSKVAGKVNNKHEYQKPKPKPVVKNNDPNKKKSIFSPENSSESDSPKNISKVHNKPGILPKPKPEPRPKAAAKIVEKPKPEKKPEKPQPKSKAIIGMHNFLSKLILTTYLLHNIGISLN